VPRHGDLLGRRLQAARDRAFVGRSEQLGLFRAALDGDPASPAVFYLHGPGGIGKSMLLRRFAAEAEADGRVVVEVDGRMVEPIPSAVETEAAPSLVDDRAVLLIDTFERCQGLEGWLRDRFLPRLPVGVLVVVAGREPPDPRWTSDPGWAVLLYVAALRNLVPDDAIALLDAHGVPAVMHNPVLAFTGGNPLALTLAAAVARRDEGAAATWRPTRDVVETLLAQLISDVPSPRHRQALEVCAHAYVTTETLLRAVLGDDAGAEFAWLRTLPFVESTGRGLFPHDVVRESLDADLRSRDPDGYEAMHRTIHGHLFQGVRNAPESGILAAVGAFLYMYRTDGHMAEFHGWRGEGEVQEAAYEPTDHADVLRLAAEAEGDASALVAAYWLDRQPEAFRIYRATQTGETVAFSAWLRLTGATGEDADPVVVATAWSHARSMAPLHLGEHIAVARFSVHPAHYQRRSPVNARATVRSCPPISSSTPPVATLPCRECSRRSTFPVLSRSGPRADSATTPATSTPPTGARNCRPSRSSTTRRSRPSRCPATPARGHWCSGSPRGTRSCVRCTTQGPGIGRWRCSRRSRTGQTACRSPGCRRWPAPRPGTAPCWSTETRW